MSRFVLIALTFTGVLLPVAARAQTNNPGSLLVFPEYDARDGRTTLLTVTNTATSGSNVQVRLNFRDGTTCNESNRTYTFTPNDTVTVDVRQILPGQPNRGWIHADARAPASGRSIDHDFLIGTVMILDGVTQNSYGLNPFAFQALTNGDTDVDQDGIRDLDGVEYSKAPDQLLFPRFMGQSSTWKSELVLLNLSGGTQFSATVGFSIRNDAGQLFTADYSFGCWKRVRLSTISTAFTDAFLANSNDDPAKSWLGREYGSFAVDGISAHSTTTTIADPVILAFLVEPPPQGSAEIPFLRGTQSNGDILPMGNAGDP